MNDFKMIVLGTIYHYQEVEILFIQKRFLLLLPQVAPEPGIGDFNMHKD